MGKRFMTVYLASVIVGSILAGLALNTVFRILGGDAAMAGMNHDHLAMGTAWWNAIAVYLFLGVLMLSLMRKSFPGLMNRIRFASAAVPSGGGVGTTIEVKGMTCSHCVAHVREAIGAVAGVSSVTVNLASGSASFTGSASIDSVRDAVIKAGYKTE